MARIYSTCLSFFPSVLQISVVLLQELVGVQMFVEALEVVDRAREQYPQFRITINVGKTTVHKLLNSFIFNPCPRILH